MLLGRSIYVGRKMLAVWHILYSWSKDIMKRHFFSEHLCGHFFKAFCVCYGNVAWHEENGRK